MAVAVCKMCGELSPFHWIGGFHCSRLRAESGMTPLRMESWPPAQSLLIYGRLCDEDSTEPGLGMDSDDARAVIQHISAC